MRGRRSTKLRRRLGDSPAMGRDFPTPSTRTPLGRLPRAAGPSDALPESFESASAGHSRPFGRPAIWVLG
eukprot:9478169-Pyramimonas_sp.AAC.1